MDTVTDQVCLLMVEYLECEEFGRLLVCSRKNYTLLKDLIPDKQVHYRLYNAWYGGFGLKKVAYDYPTLMQAARILGSAAISDKYCRIAVVSFPYKYKEFIQTNEYDGKEDPSVDIDSYIVCELRSIDLTVITPTVYTQLLKLQRAHEVFEQEMRYFLDDHPRNNIPP